MWLFKLFSLDAWEGIFKGNHIFRIIPKNKINIRNCHLFTGAAAATGPVLFFWLGCHAGAGHYSIAKRRIPNNQGTFVKEWV